MPSRHAALIAVATLACSRPPVAPAAPAATPSVAPSVAATPEAVAPPSATDAGAPSLCDRALADHRAVMASMRGDDGPWVEALGTFGRCIPTAHGAWVIAVDAVTRPSPDGGDDTSTLRGTWSVRHVDAAGAVVRSARQAEWVYYNLLRLEHASAFDYDGDGESELVLYTNESAHEGSDTPHGEVLTLRDGAVSAYAPAAGIEPTEARDVDDDGRPDLVTHMPYVGEGDDSPSDFTYLMEGPELLAHSLPDGRFSRDDAAARRFAVERCPRRVEAVFGGAADLEHGSSAVVCARLWGASTAAVTRAVAQRCASVPDRGQGRGGRAQCGDVRVLRRWAGLTPPLSLP